MADVLTTMDLIEQLESLSPAELEREISEAQDRVQMMQRLLAIIKGEPVKVRRPRQPRGDGGDERTHADIDRSLPPEKRVAAFLQANGPSLFMEIVKGAGLRPAELSPTLQGMKNVKQASDKRYAIAGV